MSQCCRVIWLASIGKAILFNHLFSSLQCSLATQCLKFGEDEFHRTINELKTITKLTTADRDKFRLYDLIFNLAEPSMFMFRKNAITKYLQEITYLKENGYFHIQEIDADDHAIKKDRKVGWLRKITLGILGPDKTIFLIKNLLPTATLDEIADLLQKKFPAIFKDKSKSFYIPHLSEENKKIKELDYSLSELDISDGDIIGIAKQKKDSAIFSRFFHHVASQPEAFVDDPDELKNLPSSKSNSNIGF